LENDHFKDNYPTILIDYVIDECIRSDIFSSMDGFSSNNQIQIRPHDQHKMTFICPWVIFRYKKLLKIVGDTFEWAMPFTFHDIKWTMEAYIDNFIDHS